MRFLGLQRRCKRGAFRRTFSFAPPLPSDGSGGISVTQEVMDRYLRMYAENYARADLAERKAAAAKGTSAQTLLERLREAQTELKRTQTQFWRAYDLAKLFGYHMRSRYTEYLLDSLQRQVLASRHGPPRPIPRPKPMPR